MHTNYSPALMQTLMFPLKAVWMVAFGCQTQLVHVRAILVEMIVPFFIVSMKDWLLNQNAVCVHLDGLGVIARFAFFKLSYFKTFNWS